MPHSSLKRFYPIAISVGLALLPAIAAAQKFQNIKNILDDTISVLQILLFVFFGIAILVFSWGIVKYISAAGDPAKLKEARSFILWGIIFIFILVAIFGIVAFIKSAFDLGVPTDIKPPTLPGRP